MVSYIALIRKDPTSDFGVDFPDFPGCVTAGRTLDEAKDAAAEALALHVEGMREDGEALPAPSDLDAVMADPHNRDAVAFLVDIADDRGPLVRINVSLRKSVLDAIDSEAAARGQTRSAFLAEAARRAMRG